MDPDHSIMAHINRLRLMAEELRSVNSPVDDDTLIVRILQTLPPSYRPFLSAWDSVPRADQTIANLTGRLVTEELRSKSSGEIDPADTAFFATHPSKILQQKQSEANAAHGKGTNDDNHRNHYKMSNKNDSRGSYHPYRGKNNHNKGNRGCWVCGMTNHKAHNCRNKKDDDRKHSKDNQYNKSRDHDRKNDNKNNSFAAVSSLCFVARKPIDWYADSGATHHMTDQRSFFSTFKEITSESWKVNGIGGTQLFAAGVGNIPVHSYVHGERKSGEFQDVLFVPGLGTNLFSIGTATDSGIDVYFSNDTVAFVKENTEIMSGQRVGRSLYHIKVKYVIFLSFSPRY